MNLKEPEEDPEVELVIRLSSADLRSELKGSLFIG